MWLKSCIKAYNSNEIRYLDNNNPRDDSQKDNRKIIDRFRQILICIFKENIA